MRRFHHACVAALIAICAVTEDALPRVHLIATGGTIAGGQSKRLDAGDLAALVPGIADACRLSSEDFVNIGSSRMTPEIQFNLAQHIADLFAKDEELAGIVVTHGTDSLEETAFLLDLLIADPRPVVFAAAQRPPRETDTDGPRNLLNAIRIAASGQRDLGVVLTMNDTIHAARHVRKTHTTAVEAFQSPGAGPLGYIDEGAIFLHSRPANRVVIPAQRIEPAVELITLAAGSGAGLIRAAVDAGAKGIVVEVYGRGNVPPDTQEAIRDALLKEVAVVFVSRTGGGRVILYPPNDTNGVICGEDLDGLKARMLLCAALGSGADRAGIQGYFTRVAGRIEAP